MPQPQACWGDNGVKTRGGKSSCNQTSRLHDGARHQQECDSWEAPHSQVMKSVLSDELVTRLRHFAACMVKETLCTRVEHMAMLAPMANKPAPEVLLNTKMSMQFSYSAPHVSSLPIIDRLCAQCAIGAVVSGTCNVCSDNGCSECIGRHYMCHTCNTRFTRRWAYETGSGRSSVGLGTS